ncbi:MAG: Mth938-like domain-containing protein [Pseudomonadota bacterium]
MRLNEIAFQGPPPIDSYGPGGFRIAGIWYPGSLIVLPDEVVRFEGFTREGVAPLIAARGRIDVVLAGQGAEIAPMPSPIRQEIEAAGIGVEIMSTPSACRTYNVLLSEDRRVGALLLPV